LRVISTWPSEPAQIPKALLKAFFSKGRNFAPSHSKEVFHSICLWAQGVPVRDDSVLLCYKVENDILLLQMLPSLRKKSLATELLLRPTRVTLPRAEQELDLVKQVLNYFVRNPNAADNLEGITRWRLLEEQIHRSLQETQVALAWLVEQGFLDEVKTSGAPPIFRLNPERRADAISFVEGESKGSSD
jgi:hypothetical protein